MIFKEKVLDREAVKDFFAGGFALRRETLLAAAPKVSKKAA